MSIGRESEAVAGIVVSADSVLVDVGGLNNGSRFGIESVAGKRTGEIVTAQNVGLEA